MRAASTASASASSAVSRTAAALEAELEATRAPTAAAITPEPQQKSSTRARRRGGGGRTASRAVVMTSRNKGARSDLISLTQQSEGIAMRYVPPCIRVRAVHRRCSQRCECARGCASACVPCHPLASLSPSCDAAGGCPPLTHIITQGASIATALHKAPRSSSAAPLAHRARSLLDPLALLVHELAASPQELASPRSLLQLRLLLGAVALGCCSRLPPYERTLS